MKKRACASGGCWKLQSIRLHQVGKPASDPLVLASGGGFSHLFARPAYQDGVPRPRCQAGRARRVRRRLRPHRHGAGHQRGRRQDLHPQQQRPSASAPLWAGLIALANQYAGHHLGLVNPALYRIARGGHYHQAFHDITTGNNTVRFPPERSAATAPRPAGIPSPAWAAPTPRCSSPCSPTTTATEPPGRPRRRSFGWCSPRRQMPRARSIFTDGPVR